MTRSSLIIFAVGLLASTAGEALGQANASQQLTIEVLHSGDDSVGRQLAYAVREEIRRSVRYKLPDSTSIVVGYRINLTSLDPEAGGRSGSMTVAAVTVTMANLLVFMDWLPKEVPKTHALATRPFLLSTWVRTVGADRVRQAALDIVANADEEIQKVLLRK